MTGVLGDAGFHVLEVLRHDVDPVAAQHWIMAAPEDASRLHDLFVSIEALSPRAQANALRWLQRLDLSGADLEQMRVDAGGGVYVADSLRPDSARTLSPNKSTGTASAM